MLPPTMPMMLPLHISTNTTPKPSMASPESDSPSEADSDPWPSPADQDQEIAQTTTSPCITDRRASCREESSLIKPPPVRTSTAPAPLLTIGKPTSSRPRSVSPCLSTSSKMSARYPSSKRITKGTAVYALSTLRMPAIASSPSKESLTRAVLKDYYKELATQNVKYIIDKRVKIIRHSCKSMPIEIDAELSSPTGSDEEDEGENAWPGPILSDEDNKDFVCRPVISDSFVELTDDSEEINLFDCNSDDESEDPPLHPAWSCKSGCKYHPPTDLSNASTSELPVTKKRKVDVDLT